MTEQQVHVRDRFAKYVIITEKRIFFFFYLLLAALGLPRCLQTFSHCSERGLLSSCISRFLMAVASVVQSMGSGAFRLQEL